MALYLVELPDTTFGQTRIDGKKAMVVEADSTDIAKELASAQYGGDGPWSQATATAIAAGVAASYVGFVYRIRVSAATPGDRDVVDLSYTATAQTVDQVGASLVTALNALALIAGAAYDNGTNVLTVAAIGDALGDRTLSVEITPAGASEPMASLVGAIVHNGIAAAVLTVVLVAQTAIPAVLRKL